MTIRMSLEVVTRRLLLTVVRGTWVVLLRFLLRVLMLLRLVSCLFVLLRSLAVVSTGAWKFAIRFRYVAFVLTLVWLVCRSRLRLGLVIVSTVRRIILVCRVELRCLWVTLMLRVLSAVWRLLIFIMLDLRRPVLVLEV